MANGDVFVGRIPQFFDLLGTLPFGVPIQSQWVLVIHSFPVDLITQVKQYEAYANADNSTSWSNTQIFVEAETADPVQQIKGCVFAQKVNTPSEGIDYGRSSGENYRGGFVKGPITTIRKDFATLDVSFLETNLSFADMILRPWAIMASHRSLLARDSSLVQSPIQQGSTEIKADISVYHLAKAGAGVAPIVRKLYNYYDCVPVNVDQEDYTYISDEIHLRNVNFLYSYYTSDADSAIVNG